MKVVFIPLEWINPQVIFYDHIFFPVQKGPFAAFETRFSRVCEWTGLSFSSDGKQILVSTNGGAICILHAYNGSVLHTFSVRDLQ